MSYNICRLISKLSYNHSLIVFILDRLPHYISDRDLHISCSFLKISNGVGVTPTGLSPLAANDTTVVNLCLPTVVTSHFSRAAFAPHFACSLFKSFNTTNICNSSMLKFNTVKMPPRSYACALTTFSGSSMPSVLSIFLSQTVCI